MIYSLKLGNPFETEAVTDHSEINSCEMSEFIERLGSLGGELIMAHTSTGDERPDIMFRYRMNNDTVVFGLGEALHGINKRGFKYISYNVDDMHHDEEKNSLYGSHNFILIKGTEDDFGLFFDYPSRMEFDIGFENRSLIKVTAPTMDMCIYLITGANLYNIVKQFRGIIGKSYTAPFWAFGFGQSRWGYKNASDVSEVVNSYRSAGIPLDMVYMDIDYMDDYKDFTISYERFPKFGRFVLDMEEQGIHLVPIIDAGIKIENDYEIYEEGKSNGYFCTNDDASLFSAAVWPGMTHFVDFFKPEAREWFGKKYSALTDYGIEGFWNDMNEPSIFYTQQDLENTCELISDLSLSDKEISAKDCLEIRDSVDAWRSPEVYKQFYHNINGKRVSHDKVHNLYGYYMTKAAYEGLSELIPDKRFLLFARSSYIGMHRYGGLWTGDNKSRWSHLKLNLSQLPGLNMCGFIYSGADIGGFGADVSEELLLRWTALGIFTPLFRNHSVKDSRNQECYRFENTEAFRDIISLRYRLLPYLYSEFLKAVNSDLMYFRPLCFDYEDDNDALYVEDQLLLGEGLMIAPVIEENANGRYVYLPEDMLFIKFKTDTEFTTELMPKGHHYIHVAIDQVPLFLRRGNMLPLGGSHVCTADMSMYLELGGKGELQAKDFEIITLPSEKPSYEMLCESEKTLVSNKIFVE